MKDTINVVKVNAWANYIKHKGGISFYALNPPEPYRMKITDTEENVIAETSNFESVIIDIDSSIAFYSCGSN